jgi:hypothetical protein
LRRCVNVWALRFKKVAPTLGDKSGIGFQSLFAPDCGSNLGRLCPSLIRNYL